MPIRTSPVIELGDTSRVEWKRSPWPGVYYKWLRVGPDCSNIVDLLKVERGVSLVQHRHSSVQASYLISGTARSLDGSILKAGSWIYIPAGIRHGHTAEEEVIWVDFFPGL